MRTTPRTGMHHIRKAAELGAVALIMLATPLQSQTVAPSKPNSEQGTTTCKTFPASAATIVGLQPARSPIALREELR